MFKFNPLSDAPGGRHGLRREITAALAFKVVALWALWFAVFRHDPALPRPQAAELFTPAHAPVALEKKP